MTQTIDAAIGARLTTYREKAGLTKSELAETCGLPLAKLDAYEAGNLRLGALHMYDICQALGLKPADLLRGIVRTKDGGSNAGLQDPAPGFG